MEKGLFGLLVGLSVCAVFVKARPVTSAFDAKMYLMQYNHMGQDDMEHGQLLGQDQMAAAIRSFQRMANVTVTGELDDDTMEMMNMPRCGMPDNMGHSNSARKKRYSAMQNIKWPINDLTWRMNSFSPDLADNDITRIMGDALKLWSDVSQLTFTNTAATDADIIIDFNTGDHGDGNPFDGPGSVLAHAYFPIQTTAPTIAGDAHFDDDETYTQNTNQGIDLFQVAAHEFGHSLGLGHSDDPNALMYAFYRGYIADFELPQDDIDGIQYLYGVSAGDDDPTMRPFNPTNAPGGDPQCPGRIDTMATVSGSLTYAFVGNQVYELSSTGVVAGFPQAINQAFPGLPNDLDASFYWSRSGKTYFFKGDQYYRYTGTTMDAGYPAPITNWGRAMPADIDAAFVWSGNNRIYFTKGDQYYRYNTNSGQIDNGYPRPLSVWGIPAAQLDSAVQWFNRRTYFFTDGVYYRYNDAQFEVDDGYPRDSAYWWFGCGDNNLEQMSTPTGGSMPASIPSALALVLSTILALVHLF